MSGTLKGKQSKAPQTAPSKSGHPETPLNAPARVPSVDAITSDHVQQFLDILKEAQKLSAPVDGVAVAIPDTPQDVKEGQRKERASKLEYKAIDEV
jgi:hypothetical protein